MKDIAGCGLSDYCKPAPRYEQLDADGRGVESYAVKEVDLQILHDSQMLSPWMASDQT